MNSILFLAYLKTEQNIARDLIRSFLGTRILFIFFIRRLIVIYITQAYSRSVSFGG